MALPFLGEFVALFAVCVFIAYVSYRLRLVPIVGFLLAGVLIGPGALAIVQDQSLVNTMAEIGVILLLFTIGVEFKLERLARIRRFIILGGSLQAGVTIAVVTLLLLLFGVEWRVGVFTSFLVVLSSTAIVMKLFADRAELDTPAGQVTLALLIFQDLAMVVMVLFVPYLSAGGGSILSITWVMVKALLVIGGVLLLARKAVPALMGRVVQTRSQELFLLTVVALCFGTAWLTNLAGVSLALGAFLAGLVVSESRYSELALSEILPFRIVFNAIFFVSIGMLLDVGFLVRNLLPVLMVAGAVLLLKATITAGTVRVLGHPIRYGAMAGLALAQICETSFVVERAGRAVGLTPAGLGVAGEQTFIAVVVLLMMATPFMVKAGPRVGRVLEASALGKGTFEDEALHAHDDGLEDHVIVVGYGPAGRRLIQVLQQAEIPFLLVELNAHSVEEAEAENVPVLYGDAAQVHILEQAGVERARLLVVVINDVSAVKQIVEVAHFLNPTLHIVARARFLSQVKGMEEAGADVVVPEELGASLRISGHALDAYLVPPEKALAWVEAAHGGDTVIDTSLRLALHRRPDVLEKVGVHLRAVTVRRGALAASASLEDLDLTTTCGLVLLSVHRNGQALDPPSPDLRLQPGDRLVLAGSTDQFTAAAHLFRKSTQKEAKG